MKIDTDQLATEAQMVAAVFTPVARPSRRTLLRWRKNRVIPFFKIGAGIYYDVEQVRKALHRKNHIQHRP